MSYDQQYADRVRQALAADARAAGTTIGELTMWHYRLVANEIACLYPDITRYDVAETLETIRNEERVAP